MSASLKNQHVLILGGTSGIGLATAKAAFDDGAKVTITGRSVERLAAARSVLGQSVNAVQLDASDEEKTRDLINGMASLDHLFITVGALVLDAKLAPTKAAMQPALDMRFWSAVYAVKYAAPKMR
jgi:NAD(P)-dependent dehydrogenase (short-subunit alcohol dehydrogenase family)